MHTSKTNFNVCKVLFLNVSLTLFKNLLATKWLSKVFIIALSLFNERQCLPKSIFLRIVNFIFKNFVLLNTYIYGLYWEQYCS